MKGIRGIGFGALCMSVALMTLPARGAVEMFLDLANIPGESTDRFHPNQVEVLSWSWGMSNSGSAQAGSGGGAGKAGFQDIQVTKYVDKASPKLMITCANGSHIEKATLFLRKAGTSPFEFLKVTMTEVRVTSVSTGGSTGEDRLTENLTLNFATVQVDYMSMKPDGTPNPVVSFGWNIAKNVAQ